MWYIKEDESTTELFVTLLFRLILNPFILMLILGALAERLKLPVLAIGYFEAWLIYMACKVLFGHMPVKKWKVSKFNGKYRSLSNGK